MNKLLSSVLEIVVDIFNLALIIGVFIYIVKIILIT